MSKSRLMHLSILITVLALLIAGCTPAAPAVKSPEPVVSGITAEMMKLIDADKTKSNLTTTALPHHR